MSGADVPGLAAHTRRKQDAQKAAAELAAARKERDEAAASAVSAKASKAEVEERLERLQRVSKKSRTELDETLTQLADLKRRHAAAEASAGFVRPQGRRIHTTTFTRLNSSVSSRSPPIKKHVFTSVKP